MEEEIKEQTWWIDGKVKKHPWHYIDVSDEVWNRNICERNKRIEEGNGGSDFYLNEGLMKKLLSMFEVPKADKIDIWHTIER